MVKDFGGERPYYGYACSPLVAGDVVVVGCGGKEALLLGLDRKTGQPLWKYGKGDAGFSSPVLYQSGGKSAVLMMTPGMAWGIRADNGEELWHYPWRATDQPTPIVLGEKVFLTGLDGKEGLSVLLELTPGGPKEIWKNQNLGIYFHSGVLVEGHVYGTNNPDADAKNATLRCVSFETGELKWQQGGLGHAPLIAADGKLIIMAGRGELVVAEASPKAFKELARAKVFNDEGWACPVLCGGRVYCRSHGGDLVCLDVKGP